MIINENAPKQVIYCRNNEINNKVWSYFDKNKFKMEEGDVDEKTFTHVAKDLLYYNIAEGRWFYEGYPTKWKSEYDFSHAKEFLKEQLKYDTCEKQAGPGLLSLIKLPQEQQEVFIPSMIVQIVTAIGAVDPLVWYLLLCDKEGVPVPGVALNVSTKLIKKLLEANTNVVIQHLIKKNNETLLQQELSREIALKIID